MIELHRFLPLVQIYAPSAPDPLIEQSVLKAAIQFCERTRTWREHDIITTDGNDPEEIDVPPESILYEISACAIAPPLQAGCPPCLESAVRLDPISIDELNRRRPGWRGAPVGGYGARWYISEYFGKIQAVPRSCGTLLVDFIVKPKVEARALPDFLFQLYSDDIATGAAGRVLSTPEKAFANPALAAAMLKRFEQRLGTLANAGERGQQRARSRVRASFM